MFCFFESQCSISNTVELISLEPNATMSSPNTVPQRMSLTVFWGKIHEGTLSRVVLTCGTGETVGCRSLAERLGSNSGGRRLRRQLSGWQICLKNLIQKLCLRDLSCFDVTKCNSATGNSNGCKIMRGWARFCRASSRSLCAEVRLWCP